MYAGKDEVFNAVTVHLDEVEIGRARHAGALQQSHLDVQSAEIRVGDAVAWGTQYHPEYSLGDIAATLRRYGKRLVDEGFFPDEAARDATSADSTRSISIRRQMAGVALRHRPDVLDKSIRVKEIANWIEHQVRPMRETARTGLEA